MASDQTVGLEDMVRELIRKELAELLPRMLPNPTDEYLTTKQVAQLTGLSIPFFEMGRSKADPKTPPYHRVGRRILYSRAAIIDWMETRKRGAK